MAPKVPKKPLKSMEKVVEKPVMKTKKKKKNYRSFSIYIYKVLRTLEQCQNIGISRNAMTIMNNFVSDQLENIAMEAGRLAAHSKKRTMGAWEIQSALLLTIPGELSSHAKMEGMKAMKLFNRSIENEASHKSK